MSLFSELYSAEVCQVLRSHGVKEPTQVQADVMPLVMEGKDLLVESQTGTGKTLAFALPILQKYIFSASVEPSSHVKVMVLVPTRELAIQVSEWMLSLLKASGQNRGLTTVIGGRSSEQQLSNLRADASVVVATPGRLLDFLDSGNISLAKVEALVLDEADKLLTLGFQEDILHLVDRLAPERQNLFFSATLPAKVLSLSQKVSDKAERLSFVDEVKTVSTVAQRVIEVHCDDRRALLKHLLDVEPWNQVMVFVASKKAARNTAAKLYRDGYNVVALHGDLSQDDRSRLLREFQGGAFKVMIATDIAARGIDLEELSCVINYDLPRSPMDYIHRVGRTGRAGAHGVAISFIDHGDMAHFKLIEKRAGIRLERESIPGFPLKGEAPAKTKGAAPVKGKRKSKKDKLREEAQKKAQLEQSQAKNEIAPEDGLETQN